mmetsp:Transcript_4601/g.13904  ORF Transcript_4601/g.13904 Transcript_4601/m.13904 type:complete len:786 (-) Transcript_4601:4143-6500(-)
MQVCEPARNLLVHGQQLRFTGGYLLAYRLSALLVDDKALCVPVVRLTAQPRVELLEAGVETVHRLDELATPVLHVHCALRLQHAPMGRGVHVHLDLFRVDAGVNHDPGPSSQLGARWDVHGHGLGVLAQGVHNDGSELEDLIKHVPHPAGEAAPVCQDEEGQALAVKVADGLCSLVRRVGVPHLARLLLDHLVGLRRRWVGRGSLLDRSSFDGNYAHGNAAQPCAPRDDSLCPPGEGLDPRASVKYAELLAGAPNELPGVVWLSTGRLERHLAVDGIQRLDRWQRITSATRDEAEPVEDRVDTFHIVLYHHMCDSVGVHYLHAAELFVAHVHVASQHLVERTEPCEDNWCVGLPLNDPLSQSHEVCSDAHAASCYVGEREGLFVCQRRLTRNQSRAPKVFDAQTVRLSDDVSYVARLLEVCHAPEGFLVSLVEVEVGKSLGGRPCVQPPHLEDLSNLLCNAYSGAGIGGQIHAGNALLPREPTRLGKCRILLRTEGARHEGDVVCHHYDLPPVGALRGIQLHAPSYDAVVVQSRRPLNGHQLAVLIEGELGGLEAPRWCPFPLQSTAQPAVAESGPTLAEHATEHVLKVVDVRRLQRLRNHLFTLQSVHDRIGFGYRPVVLVAPFLPCRAQRLQDWNASQRIRLLLVALHPERVASRVVEDEPERRVPMMRPKRASNPNFHDKHPEVPAARHIAKEQPAANCLDIVHIDGDLLHNIEKNVVEVGVPKARIAASELQRVKSLHKGLLGLRKRHESIAGCGEDGPVLNDCPHEKSGVLVRRPRTCQT